MLRAWWYAEDLPQDEALPKRQRRALKNWLFKIAIWWERPISLAEVRAALTDLPIMLGGDPDGALAAGVMLLPHDALPLSARRDDATCALRFSPTRELLDWRWGDSLLTGKNLRVTAESISVPEISEAEFAEVDYLQLNPKVQRALDLGAVTSGRGHFEAFGRTEGLSFTRRSVILDVSKIGLHTDEVSGLTIEMDQLRRSSPKEVRVIAHGAQGREAAIDLALPEGRRDFALNFLPATWASPAFTMERLELQFDAKLPDVAFRIARLTLTTARAPDPKATNR